MKKVVLAVAVIGLVAGWGAGQAFAQDKKIAFSLNAGVQTNIFNGSSFDKALFTVDGRLGVALGKSFEISPEVMAVFNYFSVFGGSGGTIVYPGVMLNYRTGGFFGGIGAVLPWAFYEGESDSGNLAPKVNIGYAFGNFQLTAYFIAWTEEGIDFLDANWAGITLGYRF